MALVAAIDKLINIRGKQGHQLPEKYFLSCRTVDDPRKVTKRLHLLFRQEVHAGSRNMVIRSFLVLIILVVISKGTLFF